MQNKMKLLCFPFSGSSALIYLSWFKNIKDHIQLVPIELAGRSKRFSEALIDSVDGTIQDLIPLITSHLQYPYALFGHSLGCLIIYELVQAIMKSNYPAPEHIFLSGGLPPHHIEAQPNIHLLTDEAFLAEIAKMGGMTSEFLMNKELQSIFLPIIRSDYKMYETYVPAPNKFLFPCDITILIGNDDPLIPIKAAENWVSYTKKQADVLIYEGHHFFIKDHSESITHLINCILYQKLKMSFLCPNTSH